jgi:hypothetical protein
VLGKWSSGIWLTLALVLLLGVVAPAPASAEVSSEAVGYGASFRLEASNGYAAAVSAGSERADGTVTTDGIEASFGSLGRIDVTLHRSGRQKVAHFKCGGLRLTYEPGRYEGAIEFEGEGGYTRVDQSVAQLSPFPFFGFGCGEGGRGEELNSNRLRGARLRGASFAHGRALEFQVNKNRPDSRAVFSASLRERRNGILIYRAEKGVLPASAFEFPHSLRTATMSPPAPFSGQASLSRSRDSAVPTWAGDLALDFLGRPDVPLAGPDVHTTLIHARFTRSSGNTAEIGFGPSG